LSNYLYKKWLGTNILLSTIPSNVVTTSTTTTTTFPPNYFANINKNENSYLKSSVNISTSTFTAFIVCGGSYPTSILNGSKNYPWFSSTGSNKALSFNFQWNNDFANLNYKELVQNCYSFNGSQTGNKLDVYAIIFFGNNQSPVLIKNKEFVQGVESPSCTNKNIILPYFDDIILQGSGPLCELICYDGLATNVDQVLDYLHTKWSIPIATNGIPVIPPASGYTPNSSSCNVWLDAMDSATLFQDLNATNPCTNNTNIGLWQNKGTAAVQSYFKQYNLADGNPVYLTNFNQGNPTVIFN
jgi:hypothetical protein